MRPRSGGESTLAGPEGTACLDGERTGSLDPPPCEDDGSVVRSGRPGLAAGLEGP